ncbi:hypothetical protein JCM9743_37470 [Natrinema sp. JCM 9743]
MRSIDEKHGVGDVVFLGEFRKKRMSENLCCCRFKLRMEQFVCLGINCSVQPVLLIIQLDHSLVNRNVIRTPIRFGL